MERRNSGATFAKASEKMLTTMDELVGLESEITGKWRRAHRPMKGAVKLRPNGQSLLERTFPGSTVRSAETSSIAPPGSSVLARSGDPVVAGLALADGTAASPLGAQVRF